MSTKDNSSAAGAAPFEKGQTAPAATDIRHAPQAVVEAAIKNLDYWAGHKHGSDELQRDLRHAAGVMRNLAVQPLPYLAKWVCEVHPAKEWPHDDCAGPGMLAEDALPHVIAAASAMLAALRDVTDAHEQLYHPKDQYRRANHTVRLQKARAAMSAAEAAGIKES